MAYVIMKIPILLSLLAYSLAEAPIGDSYATARSISEIDVQKSLSFDYGVPEVSSGGSAFGSSARSSSSDYDNSGSFQKGHSSALSREYGVPSSRNSISQEYGAPNARNSLSQIYGPPGARNAPSQIYGAPNSRSLSQYGAPNSRNSLSIKYGTPNTRSLSQKYGVPHARGSLSQEYGIPNARDSLSQEYGLPNARDSLSQEYGHPIARDSLPQEHGIPNARDLSQEYGAPSSRSLSQYNAPQFNTLSASYGAPRNGLSDSYGTPLQGSASQYSSPGFNPVPSEEYGVPRSFDVTQNHALNPVNSIPDDYTVPSARTSGKHAQSYSGNAGSFGRLSSQYGAPNERSSGLSSSYIPQQPSARYGAPKTLSSEYGTPEVRKSKTFAGIFNSARSSPSQGYGPPSRSAMPSQQYGVPDLYNSISDQGNGYARNALDELLNQEPASYDFGYKVSDYQTGSDFGHTESRQANRAEGSYFVVLPDGTKQIVEYEADERGFKPKISVEPVETDESAASFSRTGDGPY